MKPKPNADTQARVDATDQAGLAKAKADAAAVSLERWRAMAEGIGVDDVRFKFDQRGITITLRGTHNRRTVESEVVCPPGQPFPLYAAVSLSRFERAMQGGGKSVEDFAWHVAPELSKPAHFKMLDDEQHARDGTAYPPEPDCPGVIASIDLKPPERLPMTVEDIGDDKIKIGPTPGTELDDRVPQPTPEKAAEMRDLFYNLEREPAPRERLLAPETREPVDPIAAEAQRMLEGMGRGHVEAHDKAKRAEEIAARSNPIDIHKPPPAGAGARRPLSLPLCKQCKAQPVYQLGAEFCGGACAKQWHMATTAAARGIKLP